MNLLTYFTLVHNVHTNNLFLNYFIAKADKKNKKQKEKEKKKDDRAANEETEGKKKKGTC